jgi:glycine cleavage system H protein
VDTGAAEVEQPIKHNTSQIHNVPEDLLYSEDHQWVRVQKLGNRTIVRTGLTDYAQDVLGAVQFVALPSVGSVFQATEPCGEAEASKAVSDLYAPVTGSIVQVNHAVVANPSLMNQDPYGEGWLYELEINPVAAQALPLLGFATYRALIEPTPELTPESTSEQTLPVQPPGAAPTAGASHG